MKILSHDGNEFEILDGYVSFDVNGKLNSGVIMSLQKLVLTINGDSDDDLIDEKHLAIIFNLAIEHKWERLLEKSLYLMQIISKNDFFIILK